MIQSWEQFRRRVDQNKQASLAVVAVDMLTECLRESQASTYSEIMVELERAIQTIMETPELQHRIALRAGCELYKRYITRIPYENKDFDEVKRLIVQRGEYFAAQSAASRQEVANKLLQFLQPNVTVLIHGLSRAVISAVVTVAKRNRQLRLIFTESLPERKGLRMANTILERIGTEHELDISIVRDSTVAAIMSDVDFVLIGAEGVVESGGIINTIGTYQVAVVAKALGKPVYVAVESYKFVRHYPLAQSDIQQPPDMADSALEADAGQRMEVLSKFLDYTPPQYITLLITNLNQGILTPSAVSDELIKLYHEPLLTL
eukprot:EG_transcript_13617